MISGPTASSCGIPLVSTFHTLYSQYSHYMPLLPDTMTQNLLEHYLLAPWDLGYLRTVAFILVIASAVGFTELYVRKTSPGLHRVLGVYLPLITTNCAVLGVPLLNLAERHSFVESLLFGLGSSAGFTLALVVFAGLRERLETLDVPATFRGSAIAMVTAGLMSLAFMGFSGVGH